MRSPHFHGLFSAPASSCSPDLREPKVSGDLLKITIMLCGSLPAYNQSFHNIYVFCFSYGRPLPASRSTNLKLNGNGCLATNENGDLLGFPYEPNSITPKAKITQETTDFFVSDIYGDPDCPTEGFSSISQALDVLRQGKVKFPCISNVLGNFIKINIIYYFTFCHRSL